MTPQRVLVTGGSGFVGRRAVPLLVAAGFDVCCLARSDRAADVAHAAGARAVRGDLDDPASVEQAFRAAGARLLLNIASLGFGHAPAIVDAAGRAAIDRAVFVSTTAVTTALPAATKRVRVAAEATIAASSLRWTIVRPTMIYGAPDDRNIHRLLTALRRLPVLPLPGGGRRLQQPVHVEDLASTLAAAVSRDVGVGQTYDVAGPDALSLRRLIDEAATAVGRRAVLVPVPLGPTIAAVRVYERVVRRPRIRAEQLERLAEDKAFDISAARRDLGHAPRSFAEGVRQQVAATWPS